MFSSPGAQFYANAISVANELINRYGRNIRIINQTPTPPSDATKPWITNPPSIINVDTMGVFTQYDRKLIDGTTIKRTDKKLIFVATGITWELSESDLVQEGPPTALGQKYVIVNIDSITPGPVSILYTVQVRIG